MRNNLSRISSCSGLPPWLLIAAGFHQDGGMDKANAALAWYLIREGYPVYLVAHRVEPELAQQSKVTLVPMPGKSYFLGEFLLAQKGQALAQWLTRKWPDARVVVNGGNCPWSDLNWVHYVHHAWLPHVSLKTPLGWVKSWLFHSMAKRRELVALRRASLVVTNSQQTRTQVIGLGIPAARVHTVYLGSDPEWGPVSVEESRQARRWLEVPIGVPLVVFIGALGHGQIKGFDLLWSAWKSVSASRDWNARLVVAGSGQQLNFWRDQVRRAGLTQTVRFLGFTRRVKELLAAADLLVSPTRYEPYGLGVQEAICRGVPALVSRRAGVAERYGNSLAEMLLENPADLESLKARLWLWHSQIEEWKERFVPLANLLRAYTWNDMAKDLVSLAGGASHHQA